MMFRKDRKIANLNKKVENRDKLIEVLKEQKDYYKETTREQRHTIDSKDITLNNVKDLISNYETNHTNIFTLIRDIKNELDNPLKLI